MNPTRFWIAAAAVALALSLMGPLSSARADDTKVPAEVTVVLAKQAEGEYDPKLKKLPALQKEPFDRYKSMKVLSTTQVELGADKGPSVALPNGGSMQIKLVERMSDGRHKVLVSIKNPGKKDKEITVNASAEPFFVAGEKHEGGTLVIIVRVGGAAPAAAAAAPPAKH